MTAAIFTISGLIVGAVVGAAIVHFRKTSARGRDLAPAIALYVSLLLVPIFSILAFWFFQQPSFKEFGVISAILATISPVLGVAFNRIKTDLNQLRRAAESITPQVIKEYFRALSVDTATADHSLPAIAKHLYRRVESSFSELADAQSVRNEAFFARMKRELGLMQKGDRLLAICGRKFWTAESKRIIEDYWEHNRAVAARGVQVRRVFVSDAAKPGDRDFSEELYETLEAQKKIRDELRSWETENGPVDLSGNFHIREVSREARDAINIEELLVSPKFGFALISRREVKAVSLHRLDGDRLKGTLVYDPLVYSIFEDHFWKIWEVGRNVPFDETDLNRPAR